MFDGWEAYPTNLSPISPGTDVEFYHRRLQEDSKRLFSVDDTNICLETVISSPMHQNSRRNPNPDVLRDILVDDGDVENVLRVRTSSFSCLIVINLGLKLTQAKETSGNSRRPLCVREYFL